MSTHNNFKAYFNRSEFWHSEFWDAQPTRTEASIELHRRLFDLVGAASLVVLFSPLFLVVWVLARRDGGTALFAHRRVGQNGRFFDCLKFRTMVPDAEARLAALLEADPAARREWAETHKLTNDPRVTAIGRVLRKTSLDELPQLLNVLRGEMSLVGPRPVTNAEIPRYGAHAYRIFACRPGLTGLWQVGGRNSVSYATRIQEDLRYVEQRSLWLDLRILFSTARVVIARTGK